jgi:hypothetical protein
MPFGAMVAQIVGANEACQPAVSLFLGCQLIKMVERFVHVLYRTERTLDFTLGTCRGAPAVAAGRQVRDHLDPETFHHTLEHRRFCDRSVIEIENGRNALEWICLVCLARHRSKQKAERCLDVLAVNAAIFLVSAEGEAILSESRQNGIVGRQSIPERAGVVIGSATDNRRD